MGRDGSKGGRKEEGVKENKEVQEGANRYW